MKEANLAVLLERQPTLNIHFFDKEMPAATFDGETLPTQHVYLKLSFSVT